MANAWRGIVVLWLSALAVCEELENSSNQTETVNETAVNGTANETIVCPELSSLPFQYSLRQDVRSLLYTLLIMDSSNNNLGTVIRAPLTLGAALELYNKEGDLVASLKQDLFSNAAEVLDCSGEKLARIEHKKLNSTNAENGKEWGFKLLDDANNTLGETLEVPGLIVDPLETVVVTLTDPQGELLAHLEQEPTMVPLAWDLQVVIPGRLDPRILTLFAAMQFSGIMEINLSPAVFAALAMLCLCCCLCCSMVRLLTRRDKSAYDGRGDETSPHSAETARLMLPKDDGYVEGHEEWQTDVETIEKGCTSNNYYCCGSSSLKGRGVPNPFTRMSRADNRALERG